MADSKDDEKGGGQLNMLSSLSMIPKTPPGGDQDNGGQSGQDDMPPDPQEQQAASTGKLSPRISIEEVRDLWDGSRQTREKLAEAIASNHGAHIHIPTDIKWSGLSKHMKLMAVHALSDLGHDFDQLDKVPKLNKMQPQEEGSDAIRPQ